MGGVRSCARNLRLECFRGFTRAETAIFLYVGVSLFSVDHTAEQAHANAHTLPLTRAAIFSPTAAPSHLNNKTHVTQTRAPFARPGFREPPNFRKVGPSVIIEYMLHPSPAVHRPAAAHVTAGPKLAPLHGMLSTQR